MDKALVSVIVPVYNVIGTLEDCLSSVLGQTVPPAELILVDDGSTDGSAALCDSLAAAHSEIRVIHRHNAGPAAARNTGLDLCRGEWVVFVDADDLIVPNMLEIMLRAAEDKQADLVACEFAEFYSGSDHVLRESFSGAPEDFPGHEALYKLLDSSSIYTLLCNKLFRRSLISEERFDETLHLGEDLLFLTKLLPRAKRVATVPEVLYLYRIRETSLTKSAECPYLTDAIRAAEKVGEFIGEQYPEAEPLGRFRVWYSLLTVFDRMILGGRSEEDPEYRLVREKIVENRVLIRKCAYLSRKRRVSVGLITHWPGLYSGLIRRRARK